MTDCLSKASKPALTDEVEKLANELFQQKLDDFKKEKLNYRSNYYQQNKDRERQYHREWVKNNNEKYLAKRREDYKNRTTTCDICNEIMPKYYYYRHIKTKKHIKNLNNTK